MGVRGGARIPGLASALALPSRGQSWGLLAAEEAQSPAARCVTLVFQPPLSEFLNEGADGTIPAASSRPEGEFRPGPRPPEEEEEVPGQLRPRPGAQAPARTYLTAS